MNAARATTKPADDAPHVLVVDDDRRLRDLVSRFLAERGYRITSAASAAEAERRMTGIEFDCLVLDVMMPGENGFDFARRLRKTSAVPILMLTARANPADRIEGLEIGADDYLSKPFEPLELVLRLANILKRSASSEPVEVLRIPDVVRFGAFTFRVEKEELRQGDNLIKLTEREREMLRILASSPSGQATREALIGSGAGLTGDSTGERAVDVQINRLRRKIETDPGNPAYLQTVRGVGYRLVMDR
jgi:two-component system, OmpR family, phosphate regulon response regulator OmpR